MDYIGRINLTKLRREKWVIEHNKSLIKWFWNLVADKLSTKLICVSEILRWLVNRPRMDIMPYCGVTCTVQKHMMTAVLYKINYTKAYDNSYIVQNSGVTLVAQSMHISSVKDNKPVFANMSYYRVIEDIWK